MTKEKTKSGNRPLSLFEMIYEVVRLIPEGSVASYGQVAAAVGSPKLARVVGYALHVNPQPGVIPCHRVVKKDGEISPAFAFGESHLPFGKGGVFIFQCFQLPQG